MYMGSRALVWVAIFIGSTIGGAIPTLWGGEMLTYTSLLLSGIGALVGLWIAHPPINVPITFAFCQVILNPACQGIRFDKADESTTAL
jgi:predicted MFS family arabinose efflux permease